MSGDLFTLIFLVDECRVLDLGVSFHPEGLPLDYKLALHLIELLKTLHFIYYFVSFTFYAPVLSS